MIDFKRRQLAIRLVKWTFARQLEEALNLVEVQAPLIVDADLGIQDNLNGVERPVSVDVKVMPERSVEVVMSLAKWKRLTLSKYKFAPGEGLYTNMNAIRPDEDYLSPIHSIYVDQWDWEKVITKAERTLDYLKSVVRSIYAAICATEQQVAKHFDLTPFLPQSITFIQAEELRSEFPDIHPNERERKAARRYGAVFIIGIGGALSDGSVHDTRAPDYDDWSTATCERYSGLNGDILVFNPAIDDVVEISSMGIRVDPESLERQLKLRGAEDRKEFDFHQKLAAGSLPLTVGGGIGQSRMCMLLLQLHHIGQVQFSVWPERTSKTYKTL